MLVGASLLLFLVLKAAPGDSATVLRLDGAASTATRVVEEQPNGVFDAIGEYVGWFASAATGDFGHSSSLQRGREASYLIWPATFESLKLLSTGMGLAFVIALLFAVWRNYRPHSMGGRISGALLTLFSALPVFLYVYLTVFFGNKFIAWGAAQGHWSIPTWFPLPAVAETAPWLMAALILAVGDGGLFDLYQRFGSELAHSVSGDHILGARMLGLSVVSEVARGFIPGALSHFARRVSFFMGSMVVLEATLGWPGLGYLAWRAAAERDMPVLLGSALVMAASMRLALILCGIVGYAADPRRRAF